MPDLDLVRTVVLAFGKPSGEVPGGSGEAFSRLAASLVVDGQVLSTNDLTFASRDLDMTGKGTLSLATQALDLHTNVMLSRELSAQAGRDLYRLAREGDRVVLPARITGTVSSPTVFVDVAALKRAIRNRVEDEVKSLFNRWRKAKGPLSRLRPAAAVSVGSAASIRLREGSSHGGSTSVSPRCSRSSSTAKPGPSVASSKSTPPGSWK